MPLVVIFCHASPLTGKRITGAASAASAAVAGVGVISAGRYLIVAAAAAAAPAAAAAAAAGHIVTSRLSEGGGVPNRYPSPVPGTGGVGRTDGESEEE